MKKVLVLSLTLILLLGAAAHGTSGLFSDTETSTGNTFTAWVEEIEECVCTKFNVSDVGDDKIYKYDASGSFVGSFNLATANPYLNKKPAGVATLENNVYVIDQAQKQVYKYDCCGNLLGVSKTLKKTDGSGIGNPDGLAIDGDDMWVVVWGQNFIMYRYSLSAAFSGSGNLNADFDPASHPGNTQPTGLAIDDTYLYILETKTGNWVYRYPRSGGAALVSKELREMGGGALSSPAGAMFDGTSLWVVDSGTDKMYEYDITDLFSASGTIDAISEFALDSANDDASGV